jgi:hypothetical protein
MANEFKIKNGLVVSGSADFEQDLTVRGRLTADELHISIVSSSVLFESGSTQFGNSITDTHKVTGSLSITGSMSLNGQSVETNRLSVTTFNTYTASLDPRISDLETSTGSINSFTSSTNLRLTSLETSTGSINTYTASNTTNIDAIHTSTSSLNTFTSSANGRLNSIEGVTGSISFLNTYTGSNNTIIGTLQTSTGSLNSFTSSADGRLNSLETSTGSLNSYTASNTTNINAIHTATSSLNSFSSSANGRLSSIETSTGSLNSYTSSNTTNINAIHTATSSLNSYTSSNTTAVNALNTSTASLNSYTSSNTTNINAIHTSTGSLNSYTASNTTNINAIHTSTASLNTFTASASNRLTSIETSTGSLNTYTSSNTTNINAIHTSTSSLNSYTASNTTNINAIHTATASLNSFTSSATSRLNSIEGVTGSIAALNTYTGSLEGKTGSYATTGSNVFQGSQTITGSLFISQNLIVGGSSSINFVSQSTLNIGTNLITVNAQNPETRFGGLAVIDSGSSPTVSGSMLFDSINDQWIFVHQNQSTITSSVILMGPQSINSLGSELYPTTNKILKSVNAEHVGDSNITDTGTKVSVNSNTEITGSLIVAGGNKITVNATGGDEGGEILLGKAETNTTLTGQGVTIDVWQNRLRFFEQGGNARGAYLDISTLGNGVSTNLLGTVATASFVEYSNVANKPSLVSGSSQISFNGITDKPTLVSGSSQITFLSISSIPAGLVSGSSQVLNGSGVWSGSAQLPAGTVSGSSQVLNGSGVWSGSAQLPSGVVSGSSQVLNGSGVWSGSAQLPAGVVSGSSQITYSSISSIPSGIVSGSAQVISLLPSGTVSGSSQISFGSISSIPSGLVSGSSQISFGSISGVPSGLVSGSSQISFGSISGVPSGLVSGSSQISFSSISGVPSGIVSGSAQLTGSYDSRYLIGTTNPGSVGNFTISIGNNGTYSYVQSHSSQPLELNPVGNTVRIAGSTVWHAGNLTNLNQLSNGPGYITGINSSAVTTALGYTPYNATNPNGYITGISFANVSSKPTTISGYGITDAITTGNIGSQTVASAGNSTTVGGITPAQFFNNMGDNHGTRTSFDASTPSYNFGFRYVQGSTNGPGTGGSQYYSFYIGLGNDYPATGGGSYGAMFAVDRNSTTPYLSVRYNENNNFSSWRKIHAGYADTSGTAGNITAYTINQSVGTGNSPTFAGLSSNGIVTITNGTPSGATSSTANAHLRIDSSGNQYIEFRTTAASSGIMQGTLYTDNGRNAFIGFKEYTGGSNYGESIHISITDFSGSDAGSGIYLGSSSDNLNGVTTPWFSIRGGTSYFYGNVLPDTNNSRNLGSVSLGWANVYTNDLHLSNMNKPEGNDIDGTSGNWTIQEGAENLYIINNNNGKKFKISLEEII